jgi:hypothetical protein
MQKFFLALLALVPAIVPAAAQAPNNTLWVNPRAGAELPKGEARVTVTYTSSEKLPTDADAATLLVTQSKAHRAIYEIAAQECKILLETIASECRIETINIMANVQQRPVGSGASDPPSLFTNGSSTFRIKTKE